jgi:hypothetical protein
LDIAASYFMVERMADLGRGPRKLLVASVGIAAMTYASCDRGIVANLMIFPSKDGGFEPSLDPDKPIVFPPFDVNDGGTDAAEGAVDAGDGPPDEVTETSPQEEAEGAEPEADATSDAAAD